MLAFILLAFVIVAGPTVFLFEALSENIGNYVSGLVQLSFRTFAYEPPSQEGWFGGWTILYWAWWISWSPFVGMFIARISRGRTIRQFVTGVLLVPTAFNLLWMTAFGNSAIWIDTHVAMGALGQTASNVDALLFRFFEYLPWFKPVAWLTIVLIAVFFVTSADSGAFVVDNIASRGHARSPVWQRLFWAAVLGATAMVLMLAGGLKALQAMTLVAACRWPSSCWRCATGCGAACWPTARTSRPTWLRPPASGAASTGASAWSRSCTSPRAPMCAGSWPAWCCPP